jgi:glycerol-3-phosphate dehydrogenase
MRPAEHPFARSTALERLGNERFDVLVVGGGVTGTGVLLEAAARGLRGALVERRDLASGTSSRSSKLVHGGLRYLQQKEIRLVYENLAERQRLLDNAPHLVTPLPFLIPLFGRDGVVSSTVARAYSSALWAYDLTGGLRIGHRHRRVGATEALSHLPTLRSDRLVAGFVYYDARADDARLTLAVARTAALCYGAAISNYAPVTSLLKTSSGRVRGAVVEPVDLPGFSAPPLELTADSVVNATGVWTDQVTALDLGSDPGSIRPAKGVHVTVPRHKLPCDMAAVLPVPEDRRSIFVVPWGPDVYLGTTDTDYDGPLDEPKCTEEDIDYILGSVNLFVVDGPTAEDVTGTWAGLRPLLAEGREGRPISARTADLSRRHQVTTSPSGLVNVGGGKLTTYRKMASDTIDAVASQLGRGKRRSPTKSLRLHGAEDPTETLARVQAAYPDVDPAALHHLAGRYGSETDQLLALAASDPVLARPLVPGLPYLTAEAVFAVRHEMALTLDDVLSRRTRALVRRHASTVDAAPQVAALLGPEMGWTEEQRLDAVTAFLREAGVAVRGAHPGSASRP